MTRSSPVPSTPDSVRRIASEVASHPAKDALGSLAYDVLSRQAEGRVLFAGREHVEKKAAEHDVRREQAVTESGNLVGILERGPENDLERALVVGFAVHGLGARLAGAAPEDVSSIALRFVGHADWLELATAYSVLPFVDPILGGAAQHVWREVAQAIVDDATGPAGAAPAARARNAARLSALAASRSEAARTGLRAVADTGAIDGPTRALAIALAGGASEKGASVRGRVGRPARGTPVAVLRLVTGWALLAWLGRGIARLLGARHEAELALGERGLEVREERFLLGRKVADAVSVVAPGSIALVAREVRYPSLHLLVGAIALSAGLLIGGLALFDGARSGEMTLVLLGAALALGGALLDLALDVLVPGTRGRVTVELAVHRGRVVRVTRIPLDEADRFLASVRTVFPGGAATSGAGPRTSVPEPRPASV
jgi:hypothetical protein